MRLSLLFSLIILSSCYSSPSATAAAAAPGAGTGAGALIAGKVEMDGDPDSLIAQQEEILRKQQREMERQNREMEDLRRQEFHNQRMREFEGN